MIGQVSYIFLSCDNNYINDFTGTLNLTAQCNTNCSCAGVAYSPVCYEPTSTTFFSPCHAGCNRWDDTGKFYDNCACASDNQFTKLPFNYSTILRNPETYAIHDQTSPYTTEFTSSIRLGTTLPVVSSTEEFPVSIASAETTVVTQDSTVENQYEPELFKSIINTTDEDLDADATTTDTSSDTTDDDTDITTTPSDYNNENDFSGTEATIPSRQERSAKDDENFLLKMVPGACLAGCAKGFYMFTIISFIINWFGATGRIGNILLNFR